MTDFTQGFPYHETSEKIVDILRNYTHNEGSDTFFRLLTAFFEAQIASNMRVSLKTVNGTIPLNLYGICFAPSDAGKNLSKNLLEREIFHKFKAKFKNLYIVNAEEKLKEAVPKVAAEKGVTDEEALLILEKEFNSYGPFCYDFCDGTIPAFKQVRAKAQMCGLGALTFICDELGSNLVAIEDMLTVGLEAYDMGIVKTKLVKNYADQVRYEERDDPVPSNQWLFGEPSKLFDCGINEKIFLQHLTSGYARRSFFAIGTESSTLCFTPEQLYAQMADVSTQKEKEDLATKFELMADSKNIQLVINLEKDEEIVFIEYMQYNEQRASAIPQNKIELKTEIKHRDFKAKKLAGIYAFIDGSPKVEMKHVLAAIQLTEDSGNCFQQILHRDKPYVKLAKYLAEVGEPKTHADLCSELPFYPEAKNKRADLLSLATDWGYDHNIVLKRYTLDGTTDLVEGLKLETSDCNNLILSYSDNYYEGFTNVNATFTQVCEFLQQGGYGWVNHHLHSKIDSQGTDLLGYRDDEHINEEDGFNLLVLDCDNGTPVSIAKYMLSRYKYAIYFTKRNTDEANRFRIVLPMKYSISLGKVDYSDFYNNILKWFPIVCDAKAKDRCRLWSVYGKEVFINDGEDLELFNPLPFIPKTVKNTKFMAKQQHELNKAHLSKIEIYFKGIAEEGNRNNALFNYACVLKDYGQILAEIQDNVLKLNSKLASPLEEEEIKSTIFTSIARKFNDRE